MKKVLITATVQSHIAQFHKPLVELLHEHGYEVHAAARDNLAVKNGLRLDFVDKVFDVPFSRSPKSIDNFKAYRELKRIIKDGHYDIIHCNTPMGGIITRLAAIGARKRGTKVLYTAHGFHFYKGAPIKNWLIFYPIEKFMAYLCDTIITITKEDYKIAKRKFHTRVEHIHGVGVSTERYHPVSQKEQILMRKAEGLCPDDFVILCTGELNQNKNQKTLINAASKLHDKIPDMIVLLAGNGPMEDELSEQIKELKLEKKVWLLGYRTDLEKIAPFVNVVVSCSYREGLPLNIIEAMLCEKPVIVSKNRGHNELVKNNYNGYKVKAEDVDGFVKYILELYDNYDDGVILGLNGYHKAMAYTTNSVKKELSRIYGFDIV